MRRGYTVGPRPPGITLPRCHTPLKRSSKLCLLPGFRLNCVETRTADRRGKWQKPWVLYLSKRRGAELRRLGLRSSEAGAWPAPPSGSERRGSSAFRGRRYTLPVGPGARGALPVPAGAGVRAPAPPLSGPAPPRAAPPTFSFFFFFLFFCCWAGF